MQLLLQMLNVSALLVDDSERILKIG